MPLQIETIQMETRASFTIRPDSGSNPSSETSRKGTIVELVFASPIPKKLMCVYCHQLPRRPRHVTCCNSPYCLDCIELLNVTTGKCAKENCGKEFDVVTDSEIERRIQQVIVHCPRQKKGCKWIGSIENLESVHWSSSLVSIEHNPNSVTCQYEEVECPNLCGITLPRWIIHEHLLSQCEKEKAVCEGLEVEKSTPPTTDATTNHMVSLSSSPVACPNRCDRPDVLYRNIAHHLEEECPFRIVSCDYRHAGCDTELQFSDIPNHNSTLHQKHFDLVSEKLRLVTKVNCDLHQRNEKLNRHVDDLLKMIRNLDRSDYEIHVRIVTSVDTKRSPSVTPDAVGLSSSLSSLTDVKDESVTNGALLESGPCDPDDGKLVGDKAGSGYYAHLHSIGRVGTGDHGTMVIPKDGQSLDTELPAAPEVSDTSLSGSTICEERSLDRLPAVPEVSDTSLSGSTICDQPLTKNCQANAIYEDIDNFQFLGTPPKKMPEKPSPLVVGKPEDQTEKGRTKSMSYLRLVPLRFGGFSSSRGKSRLNSVSQSTTQNLHQDRHGQDTRVNELENVRSAGSGNGVAQNGNNTDLEANIYETPIPIQKRNISGPLKRRQNMKFETDSDSSVDGLLRVPLPLAYAKPIQTRVRSPAEGKTDLSKEELKLKSKFTRPTAGLPADYIEPPPREEFKSPLPHKIPILPIISKLKKVDCNPSKLGSKAADSKDVPRNSESAGTSSALVGPGQISSGHDSSAEGINILKLPPRNTCPAVEPQSGTGTKLPNKPRLRPPSKFSIVSKTGDRTDLVLSAPTKNRKTQCISDPTPLNANKPAKVQARRGSKTLKIESKLPEPISRYAAASGSKVDFSPRICSAPFFGSKHSQ